MITIFFIIFNSDFKNEKIMFSMIKLYIVISVIIYPTLNI